jgi:hypothetical protein
MSCRDKQADLPLSCCQGAMIKDRPPLLVFSRISLTMMQPSLLSLLLALATKTGAGGRSNHSRQCPHHRPPGEGTIRKSKSSAPAAPTATSTLTGLHVMDRLMRKDNIEAGVPLTMTMMTKRNLAPRGSWRPPQWDQDRPGVGGAQTPMTGLDDHRNPDGEKVDKGVEGGEDGSHHFERASYVVQFAPPILLRD